MQNDSNNSFNIFGNNVSNIDNFDKFTDSKQIEERTIIYDRNESIDNIIIHTYRYKFTETFMTKLYTFSKIHQYDHRKVFKEAWEIWVEENDNIVKDEINRLKTLGYCGDILDKMYKSSRYYFRKKRTEKKELKERREYMAVQKELLNAMDEDIKLSLNNENYKPSEGFVYFCKNHIELLKEQINIFCKNGFANSKEIKEKIKKTYKNRYFLIIKQIL